MKRIYGPVLVFLMLAAWPAFSLAQLGTGGGLPHSLGAKDQDGITQSFETLRGEKGLVLVFVRSADWCPFCQTQLIDLGEKGGDIEALGYSVVTLSYDSPDKLKAFRDKYDFPYTMLSDPDSEIIRAFGILNEEYPENSRAYGVPHPYVYVIGLDKTVKARLHEEGYKNRPSVEEITEAINALN